MIRPRWNKVLSDLWTNKVRSGLVVASIVVGLFAVGIIATIRVVITESMARGYAAVNPANINITTQSFDDDLVDVVRHIQGVAAAEGVYIASMRVQTGPLEWSSINLKASSDLAHLQINQVKLVEGAWPPKKDEIVIDQYKFADLNAQLGDEINLELANGDIRKLKLVGVIKDQTIGANGIGGGFFVAPIQGYIDIDTLPYLGLTQTYNQLLVTVAPKQAPDEKQAIAGGLEANEDEATIAQVSDRVRRVIENSGRQAGNIINRRSSEHPNNTYVDAISGILLFLGLFVVFLSGFLVTNTISALLQQQVQQIGVMKTVGARRHQIIGVYMTVLLAYGVLACAISLPLSDLAATRIMEFLASKINFDLLNIHYVPLAVVLQVVIALIVPQAAGFFPILGASRISIQEAISGVTQTGQAVKRSGIDRRLARAKGMTRPLLISLRNTFRRKGRLALTLLTLSLGGGVFIATFNVRASLDQHIAQVSRYFLADVNLTFERPQRIDRIQAELKHLPEIRSVEGWAQTRASMVLPDGTVGESINILAPQANSRLIDPVMISGRWVSSSEHRTIALSELFLSRFPNIHLNDKIKLKINGKESEWEVVGFFQLAGKSGGLLAYANYNDLSEELGQTNKAITFRIVSQKQNLTVAEQKQLVLTIEQYLKERGFKISDISAGSYLFSSAARGLNVLTAFLLIMATLIAMVGSIGLTGTMSMNVMERTREIGVMRSIGASDRVLNSMVLLEGILIGMISWTFGTVFSLPMTKVMADTINIAIFDTPAKFTFSVQGVLIWLAVVVILSVLASLAPARNATRLTIREVLAYE